MQTARCISSHFWGKITSPGIFLEINHKITKQVWSIGCLLEKLTQNPIAGTVLALASTRREYKKSKRRTVQLHSIYEELKEKTVCIRSIRHRKDIQMDGHWQGTGGLRKVAIIRETEAVASTILLLCQEQSEVSPKLHHTSSPNSSIFIYLYPALTSLDKYWHWAGPG